MSSSPSLLPRSGRVAAWPILIVLAAMACFQFGASLGKQLFPLVGPLGATAVRLVLSAIILGAISRPWRGPLPARAIGFLLVFGIALAGLNLFFYLALQRVPLAIAVAIDFTGPLSLAVIYSRRLVDLLWAALAAGGILLLFPVGGAVPPLDPVGLLLCTCTALCWALYIVFGQKAGALMSSGRTTSIGIGIAALLVLPFGVAQAGSSLLSVSVLPLGVLVAVLSSALPYNLEMVAMKRLPTRLFGVLMSMEPAFAALSGWLVLHETLSARQGVAVVCIMAASAGATLTTARVVPVAD